MAFNFQFFDTDLLWWRIVGPWVQTNDPPFLSYSPVCRISIISYINTYENVLPYLCAKELSIRSPARETPNVNVIIFNGLVCLRLGIFVSLSIVRKRWYNSVKLLIFIQIRELFPLNFLKNRWRAMEIPFHQREFPFRETEMITGPSFCQYFYSPWKLRVRAAGRNDWFQGNMSLSRLRFFVHFTRIFSHYVCASKNVEIPP